MYSKEKLRDIIEWDVYNWSRALNFWRENSSLDLQNATALEIGARNGGISLWLSEICKQVVCSDYVNPEGQASPLHKKYGRVNIAYQGLDAIAFNEREKYDLIVFKSVLGAIPTNQQNDFVRNIYNALKPGGELWFVENLEGTVIHSMARKYLTKWGARWNYLSLDNMPIEFGKFSSKEFCTFGFIANFGFDERARNILGRLDKYLLEKIAPSSMHYIVSGVCKK